MKVLNRPMFRYGGPIKEGIMSGIKEPRQGYKSAGMVFPADAMAMGAGVKVPNTILPNAAQVFQNVENQYGNQNPFIQPDNSMSRKEKLIKAYTPPEKNIFSKIADYTKEKNVFIDAEGNKRDRITGDIIVDKVTDISDINKKKAEIGMPENVSLNAGKDNVINKVIENKGKIEENPELTKKEKVNNILESLGYDRAQKNALYDAMIKAGQRISRTGLGAENLVSDVIAETSQSYDKPEKLREAANLMQVQQDLKLDQIEASKTGGKLKQDYDFYISQGDSQEVAEKKARNLPTTITEKFNASKSTTDSGKVYNVTMEITKEGFFGDKYKDSYNGRVNKKYDTVTEFIKSEDFKGDGVYNFKGEAFLIENGKVTKRQIIQPKVDKEGFFS